MAMKTAMKSINSVVKALSKTHIALFVLAIVAIALIVWGSTVVDQRALREIQQAKGGRVTEAMTGGSDSAPEPVGAASSSALPQGIPGSQIPEGDEDLYILKSQVVPPVCPACPPATACPSEKPPPPCPPCARCPEPAFECKKVPNYKSVNNEYLPRPFLADFSKF